MADIEDKYNQWLNSAQVGDTFDWFAETDNPLNRGLVNRFDGRDAKGLTSVTTVQSNERNNWGETLGYDQTLPVSENIKRLTDVGFDSALARYLVARQFGWDYVLNSPNDPQKLAQIAERDALIADLQSSGMSQSEIDEIVSSRFPNLTTQNSNSSSMTMPNGSQLNTTGLEPEQVNSIQNLVKTFEKFGLGSLAPKIADLVKQGYSSDTVSLLLADTDEYKQRFSANEIRRKAGLRVLSPAEYLSAEKSYRDIMRANGLPSGFYDSQDDYTKFIAADVSPAEMNQRVAAAGVALENADPIYKDALSSLYNMSQSDMLAYVLDPERALPIVQKRAASVRVGGAAMREGFRVDSIATESLLNNDDLYTATDANLRQRAVNARAIATNQKKLAEIENSVFGDQDALDITFGEDTSKMLASQKRAANERARFAGETGINSASLRDLRGI